MLLQAFNGLPNFDIMIPGSKLGKEPNLFSEGLNSHHATGIHLMETDYVGYLQLTELLPSWIIYQRKKQ